MKRIPRKTLSLLLLTLFAVGLLAAPASADEVVGEVEPPAPGDEVSEEVEVPAYIEALFNDSAESFLAEFYGLRAEPPAPGDEVSEDVEVPAYIEDLLNDSAESFLAEVIGSELVFVDKLTCSHTKTVNARNTYISNGDSGHYRNETRFLLCRTCDQAEKLSSTSSSESHNYYSNPKYVGSNHSGPYSNHIHNYQYTCANCGHGKIEAVPARCTAYSCVDPMSLEPPIETCSDDMIFGIYLD